MKKNFLLIIFLGILIYSISLRSADDLQASGDDTSSDASIAANFSPEYIQNLDKMDPLSFDNEMQKLDDGQFLVLQIEATDTTKVGTLPKLPGLLDTEAKARDDVAKLTQKLRDYDPNAPVEQLIAELEKPEEVVVDYAGKKRFPAYAEILGYDDLLKLETSVKNMAAAPEGLLAAIGAVKDQVLKPLRDLEKGLETNNADQWLQKTLQAMEDGAFSQLEAVASASTNTRIKDAIVAESANRKKAAESQNMPGGNTAPDDTFSPTQDGVLNNGDVTSTTGTASDNTDSTDGSSGSDDSGGADGSGGSDASVGDDVSATLETEMAATLGSKKDS